MNTKASNFDKEYWEQRAGGKFLTYVGPPLEENLEIQLVKGFVKNKGALGAIWSYGSDCAEEAPWYRLVCDISDYDTAKIVNSKTRYYVRRSLRDCSVRQVGYDWLADNGYEVYINAASRYSYFRPLSEEKFRQHMRGYAGVPGYEALGAFIGDKLVAYALVFIVGDVVEARVSKFDPAYSKARPMYALQYTIVHHYLNERGFKEIDSGPRPLMHETNIVDFLMHLGYRKRYGRLGLYLTWPARVALRFVRIFRRICKLVLADRRHAILESLLLAQDIAKATEKH